MSAFTETELRYLLSERRLARLATVGRNGTLHVVPVGWRHNREKDTIDIGGYNLEQTKKYRDVQQTKRAAVVIDELASVSPWRVRGIEIRGRAEALKDPTPLIRLYPERVVSWGIEEETVGVRRSRNAG